MILYKALIDGKLFGCYPERRMEADTKKGTEIAKTFFQRFTPKNLEIEVELIKNE
jgi:hypothetical protein